ncbi:cytidine deaminase [Pseudidiomarina terrestris]|uniref:Cytidine deaminase n=1 Tax=Pseudidiomarina terrestris TaxID=2820060 RepID=A0AAW7QZW2_9GAMM|nr:MULTISPECIES: cytidine deaminase [unclassified Pseudidiomarina]MDN7125677.1 cytidine deaminase [Pseudidiomarina sp. 1APP75-32.1]MDN7128126.1 cytidine deaminase [Pseudidiomarina sp. 1APR75-33.1]MDN7130676.1 cytidine deaminase [Pseudidiomarina sp. 1APR75-15]MDN7136591.1 cytidine deaminase [Pseudidiomarina sp. 1ASP75-5]MEA3589124.1 cytidine deaminase [Pseudidiomarina sp. 1APP75-27a]
MTKQTEQVEVLRQHAKQASEKAYAPYSNFPVGAAIMMRNGDVIRGCNVENVSYGLSNCAERTAIFSALAQGYQASDMETVVIYTPGEKAYAPCGACRQVLAEFLSGDTQVSSTSERQFRQWRVADLLPEAFEFDSGAYRNKV